MSTITSMGYNNCCTMKPNSGETAAERVSGTAEDDESRNRRTVKMVYKALRDGETENVAKVVRAELEWWYHGPPQCHHMMRALTGESTHKGFKFRPRRIRAVGERVMVEGWEGAREYWVHVWRLKQGIVAQLREYFNTSLTVVLRVSEDGDEARVWRTNPKVRARRSLPELVLSI